MDKKEVKIWLVGGIAFLIIIMLIFVVGINNSSSVGKAIGSNVDNDIQQNFFQKVNIILLRFEDASDAEKEVRDEAFLDSFSLEVKQFLKKSKE